MAVTANPFGDVTATLATTLTRIDHASTVDVVWFICDTDCYLVYSSTLADGAAVPSNRGYLMKANVAFPIEIRRGNGGKAYIAASSGTPTGYFLPLGRD